MDRFYIIWPEKRFVAAGEIKTWYEDAVANGEIDSEYEGLSDDEVEIMADALHQAGAITLGKEG
jgi:hypothetical protein